MIGLPFAGTGAAFLRSYNVDYQMARNVASQGLTSFTTLTELARHLGISVPGVGYAVERGEAISRDNNYQLIQ
jgi:hypothetical protein